MARDATKSQIECNNANGLRSHPYSQLVFTFFLHTQSWTDPISEGRHLSDMSIILQKQSPGLAGSFSDQYGECCPPVLDPYTLLALLGGIALATFFLQQVITMTMFVPPGRKKRSFGIFGTGKNMNKDTNDSNAMFYFQRTLTG